MRSKMFKFNFNSDSNEIPEQRDLNVESSSGEAAIKVCPTENIRDFVNTCTNYEIYKCADISIKHISPLTVLEFLNKHNISSSIIAAESNHSDLLSGVYEGGLKVWECTFDLLSYLERENINFHGAKVLDLGCGAGLLGIYALFKGASHVCFQDYNKEVVEYTTIPNVILNGFSEKQFQCFCGDWKSFTHLCNGTFDFILTSETIYNVSNYKKLVDVFRKCGSGEIYVAAKCYYFGVGGGIQEFEKEVAEQGDFNVSMVWKCDEGIKRQIIKIKQV